jgi:hypothetical protein
MTSIDNLGHVVDHARRWQIPGTLKMFVATPVQIGLSLPDGDLPLFLRWARSLVDPLFTGHAPGPIGSLEVSGTLMCGRIVHVTVRADGDRMRAEHATGVLVLGQVEQYAHRIAVAA